MIDFLEPVEMPKIGLDSPIAGVLARLEQLRGCNSFLAEFANDPSVVTPDVWLSQLIKGDLVAAADSPTAKSNALAAKSGSGIAEPTRASLASASKTSSHTVASAGFAFESVESIESHIRDLHRSVVGESGGTYRRVEYIPGLMWDLARFLRVKHPPQFDFFKLAFVFRRLLWIHPFPTGNADVARALAREMLAALLSPANVQVNFAKNCGDSGKTSSTSAKNFAAIENVQVSSAKNCAAIENVRTSPALRLVDFSVAFADDDPENKLGVLARCESTLRSLYGELARATNFARVDYVRSELLEPALQNLESRRLVSEKELAALKVAVTVPEFSAQDLAGVWADQFLRSRSIRKMLEAGLIVPTKTGGRKYTLNIF